MKALKSFFKLAPVVLICSLLLISCSKKDDVSSVTQVPTDGSWRVSYFFDSGDETNHFSGYAFTFNSNGQVTASNGSNTITGTWSLGSSKFNLNFGTDPVFEDLNDDWLIEEKTATSIKLKDDNPARIENLHFQKL